MNNNVLHLMFFMPGFKSHADLLKHFFQHVECPETMRAKLISMMDGVLEVYEHEPQVKELTRYGLGITLKPDEYEAWLKMRSSLNLLGFCHLRTSDIGVIGNYFLLSCPRDRLIDDCAYYDRNSD